MRFRKKLFLRILSTIICTTVAFTIMPGFDSYAKTTQESNADQIALLEIAANTAAVDKAYNAVMKARSSKKTLDKDYALSLITALSPTNKVRLYVKLSKDYYFKNYRIPGFKYFDAEKYLSENPDVRLAGINSNVADLFEYALRHYLEYGIYDARESETSFDPIVAILAEPEAFEQFVENDTSIPDAIYNNYVKITGKKDTSDKKIIWTAPKSTEKYKNEPLVHELTVVKEKPVEQAKTAPKKDSVPEVMDDDDDDEDYDDDDDDDDDEEDDDDPPVPEKQLINNFSVDLTPYKLYSENGAESFELTTNSYTYPDAKNGNLPLTVKYNNENYEKAKEIARDKKYTFMVYMCGTDQEVKESYRRVSVQIASMLQADDLDEVNVLLFLGGTEHYANAYLDDRIKGVKSGIYYVNPSALSDDVRSRLKEIEVTKVFRILEGKEKDPENLAKGLTYNDIINEDSLIELSTTSYADMADPAMLSGFINFSTNLFPAEDYGLSLSNHGGGLLGGVIATPDYNVETIKYLDGHSIGINMLESALAASDLYNSRTNYDNGRLGLIFYDACLMGTSEQAFNTMDYYRYMVASEEVTIGSTEYGKLLSRLNEDVKNGSSDKDIAINLTKDFSKTAWHSGDNSGLMSSIAVFSSDQMKSMYDKINLLSKELSEVLSDNKYSDRFRKDIFTVIRKAGISTYPTEKKLDDIEVVDIGDFYTYLEDNLYMLDENDESYNTYDSDAFKLIKEELTQILNSGFLVYLSTKSYDGFGEIVGSNNGNVIPLNYGIVSDTDIWTDLRNGQKSSGDNNLMERNYPYACSIFLPLNAKTEDYKNSNFYKYYAETELNDYVNFVEEYLKFLNNSDETGYQNEVEQLKKEMSEKNLYTALVSQEEGNKGNYSTITDSNNKELSYISFKVPDTYEEIGLDVPEHSTGSPMLDIIETNPSINIAAVHKQYFDATDNDKNGFLMVDMICAEKEIEMHNYGLGSNTIYFDVTDFTKSIITGLSLNGHKFDKENWKVSDKEDWQFVLASPLESKRDDKIEAMKTIFEDIPSDDKVVTITGSVMYDNPDDSAKYLEKSNTYHVFYDDKGDDNLNYYGTVEFQYDEETQKTYYTKVDKPFAISAYHYVLRNELDEKGNLIKSYKEILEGHDGFTDGYYNIPNGNDGTSLYISSVYVTEKITEDGKEQYSNKPTGYVIGMNESYSDLAYIDKDMYEDGNNVGDGNLGKIDLAEAKKTEDGEKFIDEIGGWAYIEEDQDYSDDYDPNPEEEEEESFVNTEVAKDATAADDVTLTENADMTESETDETISRENDSIRSDETVTSENIAESEETVTSENVTESEEAIVSEDGANSEETVISEESTETEEAPISEDVAVSEEIISAEEFSENVAKSNLSDLEDEITEEKLQDENVPEENAPEKTVEEAVNADAVKTDPMEIEVSADNEAA